MDARVKRASEAATQEDEFFYGWRFVNGEQVPLTQEDVLHPEEGDVIMQSSFHWRDLVYLFVTLDTLVRALCRGFVMADLRTDWEHESVRPHAPDVMVYSGAIHAPTEQITTFKPKSGGFQLTLIIEVTSPSTRANDLGPKVEQYHRIGCPFYAIVDRDPTSDGTRATLLAYRHSPEGYLLVEPDEDGLILLNGLNVFLGWREGRVVLFDSEKTPIPDSYEVTMRLREATRELKATQKLLKDKDAALQSAEQTKAAQAETLEAQKLALQAAEEEKAAQAKALEAQKLALQTAEAEKAKQAKALQAAEAEKVEQAAKMAQLLALLSQHGIQLPPQQGNPN